MYVARCNLESPAQEIQKQFTNVKFASALWFPLRSANRSTRINVFRRYSGASQLAASVSVRSTYVYRAHTATGALWCLHWFPSTTDPRQILSKRGRHGCQGGGENANTERRFIFAGCVNVIWVYNNKLLSPPLRTVEERFDELSSALSKRHAACLCLGLFYAKAQFSRVTWIRKYWCQRWIAIL